MYIVARKNRGGGRLNALKTLLLSRFSHFSRKLKTVKSGVKTMLFDIVNKGISISDGIEKYQRFRGNYAKDFFARYKDQPGWETNLPDSYFNMGQNVNFNNASSIANPAEYPWYIKFPKPLVVLECYTYCNNWAGITEMAFIYEDGTVEALYLGPKSYSRIQRRRSTEQNAIKRMCWCTPSFLWSGRRICAGCSLSGRWCH